MNSLDADGRDDRVEEVASAGESSAVPRQPEARHEQRLQKIIAAAGVTSRRKAEELIVEGRVQVNGQTVTELGTKADPARDHIRVDGKLLRGEEKHRYFMLNKPKGYVTTVSDPEKRPTVMQFFKQSKARVFPVGRLDYQSEGLLLMTNDGDLANLLTKASSKVDKTYLVKVSRKPSENAIAQLRAGIMIDRGRKDSHQASSAAGRVLTQPAAIRLVRDAENPWYEVTLTEGRNRQIRKLFEEVGHFVEKIRRVGYGPLVLDVAPGEIRELSPEEVLALQRAARGIPRSSAASSRTGAAKSRTGSSAASRAAPAKRAVPRSAVGKAAIKRAIGPARGPNSSRTPSGATRGPKPPRRTRKQT
ncbi:MAG TPA: pseudouridine synthase [Acidisarcina sp.]